MIRVDTTRGQDRNRKGYGYDKLIPYLVFDADKLSDNILLSYFIFEVDQIMVDMT